MTDYQWDLNAQLEGAMKPVSILTHQTEGDVPLADMERVYLKRCIKKLTSEPIWAPRRKSSPGAAQKFDLVKWRMLSIPSRSSVTW